MSRFIEMDGADGAILVEVDNESIDTLELVRAKEKWPSFSSALDTLLKHGKLVLEKSKELSPNEVELEFGIKGGIEAGIPVWGLAKASSEGNITVKMHWKDKTSK